MKKTGKKVSALLACINLVLLLASVALAQTGSSTVSGTITDSSQAAIPNATVTLKSEARSFSRTMTADASGNFLFPSVPTGAYTVEVEAKGFKKTILTEIQALVDNRVTVAVTLEAGQVTESVTVTASAIESIINTQDASLGNNFVGQQIIQLPLEGRNVANLLSLQAAVTPDGSVAGGRRDQANVTLDGVDINDQQTGLDLTQTVAFSPVLRVNPDSVEEFRVTTTNADASKGRSSGAQISLITRGGTNEFHGAIYEYHRNTVTTANDWFNNATGVTRPKLIRNLFGGRLGGPIVKDRLFFFYNYEGMREAKGSSVARVVPTASLAAGNIRFVDSCAPNCAPRTWTITTPQINSFLINGAPVVDVNSLVPTLFGSAVSRYAVNDSTQGDGLNTGGFRFNAPTPVKQNAHTARFDWTITGNQKHLLSIRGNYQNDLTGAAPYFPDTPATNTWSHPFGLAATYTWLIGSNLTNRLSYGQTRLAFSNQGDSNDPNISFRRIFQPSFFARGFNRTNPTQNFTDDFTWIKSNHSFQFGTNIRLIKNTRVNFANSFDNGITNPSAYASNVARTAINQYIATQTVGTGETRTVASAWDVNAQSALVALFGRLSGYGANFNFDTQGSLLPAASGIRREFKTDEYDFYLQDSWKLRSNLTLTGGLRYGLSMPVTETQGYETVPTIELSTYLANTIAAMNRGENYREIIRVRKAGKVNGFDSMYPLDKNNFQPRVSVAWSPKFNSGVFGKLFGKESDSVIRAGFAMTNDYFGQQLATNWDGANTLGFSSSSNINVNTYNLTTNPAPLYTGPGMVIRSLPRIVTPGALTFPQTAPSIGPGLGKIETSLDQNLISPTNYSWNLSYGRRLPGKIWVEGAYIGRVARNLLAGRDVAMLRGNIRDTRSGLTYNQAATLLDKQLQAGAAGSSVAPVAFFENMWRAGSLGAIFGCPAGTGGASGTACTNTQAVYYAQPNLAGDWTYMMQLLDGETDSRYFFQGQYDALSAFGTIGSSDYHGATLSIRQRLSGVTWDFNYTFSKSIDTGSGLQTGGLFGSTFILNSFNINDNRAVSDFDTRHIINFNGIWDLPIGRGKRFGSGINKAVDAFIGGWQLNGIFRASTGLPYAGYADETGWQTNWQIRSFNVPTKQLQTGTFLNSKASACVNGCTLPNLFANPDEVWKSFRTPHPGETGARNPIRYPGSANLDAGLAKSFSMPWDEKHKATFRWDVFNVTNTPVFTGQAAGLIGYTGSSAGPTFGRFTGTRNNARIMQFALRYDF
ncbi:MAG: TonB-dependent receptor [Acidobacteria bacterium]|nr:TonB-dependent receptor [Acidobacteriota bacterium]